jgi:hypothetical protein
VHSKAESATAPKVVAAPAPKAVLPALEMRYVAVSPDGIKIAIIVHADGRLERPGMQPARIVGGRIVCDDGSELLHVDADGGVHVRDQLVAHLTADGGFAMDPSYGGWSARVLDDGDASLTTPREGLASSHDIRWEGFRVEARRTASLFTGFLTPPFGGMWCGVAPPTRAQ